MGLRRHDTISRLKRRQDIHRNVLRVLSPLRHHYVQQGYMTRRQDRTIT